MNVNFDLFEASKKLSIINVNLGHGMHELFGYWCRVVVSERERKKNTRAHRHSFYELHLCLENQGIYQAGNNEITVSKSEFVLFPPKYEHRIVSEPDGFRKFVWGFEVKDGQVDGALRKALSDCKVYSFDDEILTALDIILKNAYDEEFGYFDVIKGQLSYIFALIVRTVTDISEQQTFGKKPLLVVWEIKKYILDNLAVCPTVKEISAQFLKSPGTLDKLCMDEYGMSLSAFKKQLQFERIKELLSETDYNLDKISELCGFADRYTMGKFFKKYEGTPPGEFRKWIKR